LAQSTPKDLTMPEKWRHQPGCNNVLPQQLSIVLVSREKSLRNFIENLEISVKVKDRKKKLKKWKSREKTRDELHKKKFVRFTPKNSRKKTRDFFLEFWVEWEEKNREM
jgi:hypothetical protein